MGGNLTAGSGSKTGAALLPTLSPNTAAVLATPTAIRTTEEGVSFEVPAGWQLPRDIPETLVVECRRWLVAHNDASGYAQEGRIKHWLIRLLGGLPGDFSPEAVQLKMGAFVFALSDYRAYCFDDATLKLAMRRFKFWPSSAELIAFADEMDQWTRTTAARAHKVIDAGARVADASGADRAIELFRERQAQERARERAALAAIVEAKYGPLPSVDTAPVMQDGESRASFIDRLREWRKNPVQRVPAETADGAAQNTMSCGEGGP
jgi:hypothetical protein